MSINSVTLLGNIGSDPKITQTQDGKKIASFSVATSEKWKDKTTGEFKENTEWHRVVIFVQGLSNIVEKYLNKGDKVYIEGALKTRQWKKEDGSTNYVTEIVLSNFNSKLEILSNKKAHTDVIENPEYAQEEDVKFEDDIPF